MYFSLSNLVFYPSSIPLQLPLLFFYSFIEVAKLPNVEPINRSPIIRRHLSIKHLQMRRPYEPQQLPRTCGPSVAKSAYELASRGAMVRINEYGTNLALRPAK